ncbi:MAG: hypothetical protein ACD_62C00658G0013 [uncultured bacterium]|nr:MAG: hypothetical protein ACD_62C00658G0013 [uncultured bacterium]
MLQKNNKKLIGLVFFCLVGIVVVKMACQKQDDVLAMRTISPVYGVIQSVVSTTGTVVPQNRLELKPPVAGRIEDILVVEGQSVKKGDVLALMSSTERVALLDSARLKSDQELKYWQDVYLATPVLAPIDGVVIVRSVEPGQTVVTGDAVLVLSDRLIVKAQIDEVDLGRIALGQTAQIRLDAYPQNVTAALVDHISFESTVVNNVTIYEVDVLPQEIPAVFRSGMSATVDFFEKNNDHALLIPHSAVISQSGEDFVLVLNAQTAKQEQRKISLGLTDGENVEVTQGLTEGDVVLLQNKDGVLSQKKSTGKNPFMPNFEKKK